jgi:hypothetical protein
MTDVNILDDYTPKKGLAQQFNKSERTLDRWDVLRIGPPRTMIGSAVYYYNPSTRAWLRAQERKQPRRARA